MPGPAALTASLFASIRAQGKALLNITVDPHAELLALVWGPRFDREHAHALLARQPGLLPGAARSIMAAADSFDRLPPPRQQRLRRMILRHRHAAELAGRWDNPPHGTLWATPRATPRAASCAPHPAD